MSKKSAPHIAVAILTPLYLVGAIFIAATIATNSITIGTTNLLKTMADDPGNPKSIGTFLAILVMIILLCTLAILLKTIVDQSPIVSAATSKEEVEDISKIKKCRVEAEKDIAEALKGFAKIEKWIIEQEKVVPKTTEERMQVITGQHIQCIISINQLQFYLGKILTASGLVVVNGKSYETEIQPKMQLLQTKAFELKEIATTTCKKKLIPKNLEDDAIKALELKEIATTTYRTKLIPKNLEEDAMGDIFKCTKILLKTERKSLNIYNALHFLHLQLWRKNVQGITKFTSIDLDQVAFVPKGLDEIDKMLDEYHELASALYQKKAVFERKIEVKNLDKDLSCDKTYLCRRGSAASLFIR